MIIRFQLSILFENDIDELFVCTQLPGFKHSYRILMMIFLV